MCASLFDFLLSFGSKEDALHDILSDPLGVNLRDPLTDPLGVDAIIIEVDEDDGPLPDGAVEVQFGFDEPDPLARPERPPGMMDGVALSNG